MRGKVIAGIVLAGIGLVFLARKAAGEGATCLTVTPNIYHYVTYLGPTKRFKECFSPEAWNAIYSYEIYEPNSDEWVPLPDAENYIIEHGQYGRIIFTAPVEICNFEEA